jgi:hypothetical protein
MPSWLIAMHTDFLRIFICNNLHLGLGEYFPVRAPVTPVFRLCPGPQAAIERNTQVREDFTKTVSKILILHNLVNQQPPFVIRISLVILAEAAFGKILLKGKTPAGAIVLHMVMRKSLVPWIPFNTELEVVIPYPGRNPVPDHARRDMVVEAFPFNQLPDDAPGTPAPVRHKLREGIKETLVVAGDMRVNMRVYGCEHIVFITMRRQEYLDTGTGRFDRFYKNELVFM